MPPMSVYPIETLSPMTRQFGSAVEGGMPGPGLQQRPAAMPSPQPSLTFAGLLALQPNLDGE